MKLRKNGKKSDSLKICYFVIVVAVAVINSFSEYLFFPNEDLHIYDESTLVYTRSKKNTILDNIV